MKDNLLDFVKGKLEEGEGITPDALARLVSAADEMKSAGKRSVRLHPFVRYGMLLAASLAFACCGWLMRGSESTQREVEVSNVIALLQMADGSQISEGLSLSDALLSWQDAPCADTLN